MSFKASSARLTVISLFSRLLKATSLFRAPSSSRILDLIFVAMYLITSYEEAEKYIGRKADRNRKIYNGMIKSYFYQFMGPKPPKKKENNE